MGMDPVCYYLVPAGIGAFGLFMTAFLRRCMRDEPSRIERELQRLTINQKTKKQST